MCKIGSPLLSFLLCSLCTPLQALVLHKFFYQATPTSHFHRIHITCSFSFKPSFAAESLHRNFDFLPNPIPRLIKSSPFAPVQNMAVRLATNRLSQKILTCSTFQILLKNHRTGFEPLSGSPEGRYFATALRRLGVFLVTFCTPQKVTEKTSLLVLFVQAKSTYIVP